MNSENPPGTINDVLDLAVRRFGERTALVDGSARYTYREVHEKVLRAAHGLRGIGVEPGDRVAIWLPNRLEWCVAFFAAVRVGAIVVPLNTALSASEATYQLEQSGSTVVVAVDQHRSRRLGQDA